MKKILLFLPMIFLFSPSYGAIEKVHNTVNVTSMSFTIVQPTAGNALIATIRINGGNGTAITGGGVTWTKIFFSSSNRTAEIWCGPNSSGVGTNVVVSTNAGAAPEISFSEWSGMDCSLDGTPVRTQGTSAAVSAGTMTITNAGSLVIGKVSWAGNAATSAGPTHSFTDMGVGDTGLLGRQAFRLPGATGDYTTGWTIATSQLFDGIIVAFAPTAEGGGSSSSGGGGTTRRNLFGWFY
jgi:hypothetical protein